VADDFDEFCAREFPRLVGALALWCGDRDVAEEVVQEALARTYRDWHRVRDLDRPGAWTRRVAMNLARSRFRRWQAERRAKERGAGEYETTHHDPDSADAVAVRRAVAALPASQRDVLIGRYFLDLSVEETAEMLGRTSTAVTSLTHRAVMALRQALGEDVAAREGKS
jgi:RNA polymerase sigma-70 factor (sigma-E family)